MTEVQQNPAPPRLEHVGLPSSRKTVDQLELSVIVHVRMDVAGTQMI